MNNFTNAKRDIKSVILQLMSENAKYPFKVTEIVEKASLNRSTFYLYYNNVDEVMEEIYNDYFDSLASHGLNPWECRNDNYYNSMLSSLLALKENSDDFKILTNEPYFPLYQKYAYHYYTKDLIHNEENVINRYAIMFQFFGCNVVIRNWVAENYPVPPEKLALFLTTRFTTPDPDIKF